MNPNPDMAKGARPKPLLADHRRTGKKLIPPFLDRGWQMMEFADTILPELIWIGFLQNRWGFRVGAQLAIEVIKIALDVQEGDFKPEFGFASVHRGLSPAQRTTVHERLHRDGTLAGLQEGLRSFLRCYPEDNPLEYLGDSQRSGLTPDDIDIAKRVIGPRISRWSKEGTAMQAVIVLGELTTGRLHLPEGGGPPMDFDAIFDTPDSTSANESGGYLRASMSSAYAFHGPRLDRAWSTYFWRRGHSLEPIPDLLEMRDAAKPEDHVLAREFVHHGFQCFTGPRVYGW